MPVAAPPERRRDCARREWQGEHHSFRAVPNPDLHAMLDHAPGFDANGAAALARHHWDIEVTAVPLPSERDQNFLLTTHAGDHFVLKVSNALEDPALLDAQQLAMSQLSRTMSSVPRVIPTTDAAMSAEVIAADGKCHRVWAITYLDGIPMGALRSRTPDLIEDFGHQIGALVDGMSAFDHPAIHREFHWDLAQGRRVVADYRPLLDASAEPELCGAIDALITSFDQQVAPLLPSLRTSAIHGDLNDYNVLVDVGPSVGERRVSGIVDFGDMVHSYTVGDVAIAGAYLALGATEPLVDLARLVRGHHSRFPLQEVELRALFGLVALRLCTSACMAAHQRRERPDNAYLDISQSAIFRTLPKLARIPFGLAEAVVRDACGLEPNEASVRVRSWLAAHTDEFAPVIAPDPRSARAVVLDLSVGSPLISGDTRQNAEPALTERIAAAMRAEDARIGIGRYDEARLLYTAPFFAASADPDSERRTIHLGLDLFADAGTPVHAPLAGVVHAFADNCVEQDYGPVIVLRHQTDDATEFFTLYGHLSRASLQGLHVGKGIARGERIGALGRPEENVGWTPHLHLQVVTDLLGLGTDFPGVGRASERRVWCSLSPDPNLIVGIPHEWFPATPPTTAAHLAARALRVGRNLSVAYDRPVRVERGWRQFLYDDEGRRYLDAYNNVPHVGHCHPRVVQAAQAQMSVLNTNTRYLSDRLIEYTARLTATFPEPLRVCYLLNSASEANELALRLTRAHTGRRDMIVLDAAYHGNTTSLIDLSPYKHAGPGGSGAPDWVHVAPLPDDYRGPYKRSDADAGSRYAGHIARIIAGVQQRGRGVAGFIAETCPSVGGQLILPPRYLAEAYAHVRGAGGVCIADEVQTGLGRMGTHFWAFEAHGVVPDIVVMGKPLGNGHPMAAVVTTPEIADSFANGMEFFSTFGGNDVSCATGLAVLDVLRDEQLQAHARTVGERLLSGLRPLVDRFEIVGDVRGAGLFLGVELVRDRQTLQPAAAEASHVVNRMRDVGILVGTDGPYHNVVKIRPPMPFDETDADRLVETFTRIVGTD